MGNIAGSLPIGCDSLQKRPGALPEPAVSRLLKSHLVHETWRHPKSISDVARLDHLPFQTDFKTGHESRVTWGHRDPKASKSLRLGISRGKAGVMLPQTCAWSMGK